MNAGHPETGLFIYLFLFDWNMILRTTVLKSSMFLLWFIMFIKE